VIVIKHEPDFSPRVAVTTLEAMRRSHPSGETVGAFEVRWR
jgi:hypothetical protein